MAFLGLIILMAVLLAWNICAGSVNISVKEVTGSSVWREDGADCITHCMGDTSSAGAGSSNPLVGHWRWQGICF